MVKMSSTPGKIECIQSFVDEEGYYPSHSLMAVVPNESCISSYVICALINSKLINAFVRMECVKRTVTTEVIRSIPVPDFTEDEELVALLDSKFSKIALLSGQNDTAVQKRELFSLPGMRFFMIYPNVAEITGAFLQGNMNNASIVCLLESEGCNVLFSGDLEIEGWRSCWVEIQD